jgi:hypothetical protein
MNKISFTFKDKLNIIAHRSMFKCCGIRKPDPLNPPHRGTLKIKKEMPKFLPILSPIRREIERGLLCFQQLLIKERNKKLKGFKYEKNFDIIISSNIWIMFIYKL